MGVRIPALIMAGRANTGALRQVSDAPWEAMIPVAGRPMAARVADALRGSAVVGDVWIVGPDGLAPSVGAARFVAPGGSLLENLRRGVAAVEPDQAAGGQVLVVGGDVPLLTPAVVDSFLERCAALAADVCYPIVRRDVCLARYPGARRTWARLREGVFTGGNAFLLRQAAVPLLLGLLERFYAARKSPVRLAALLGPGLLLRYAAGLLSVGDVEERFQRLSGLVGRAVEMADPEIAMDVDRPEDLEFVSSFLQR